MSVELKQQIPQLQSVAFFCPDSNSWKSLEPDSRDGKTHELIPVSSLVKAVTPIVWFLAKLKMSQERGFPPVSSQGETIPPITKAASSGAIFTNQK